MYPRPAVWRRFLPKLGLALGSEAALLLTLRPTKVTLFCAMLTIGPWFYCAILLVQRTIILLKRIGTRLAVIASDG